MNDLLAALEAALRLTRFDIGYGRQISVEEMREWRRNRLPGELPMLNNHEPIVPDGEIGPLLDRLDGAMSAYKNPKTGMIGYGLHGPLGGTFEASVRYLANELICAATLLGPERAIELLSGWIGGGPVGFESHATLPEVTVNGPLNEKDIIRITPMPSSTDEVVLPHPVSEVPHEISRNPWTLHFSNVAVLSIRCTSMPAFYCPKDYIEIEGELTLHPVDTKRRVADGLLPSPSVESFCEALSLAAGTCIRPHYTWRTFGETREFSRRMYVIPRYNALPHLRPTETVSKGHVTQAIDICWKLKRGGAVAKRLDQPINRWIRSKRPEASLADQFIELRIALESLYLTDGELGELSVRLASYGACHLGASHKERVEVFEKLREAYSTSSRATHRGEIKETSENKELLRDAQALCRRGILKRLDERKIASWAELVL